MGGSDSPKDLFMKLYYSPGACSLSPHIALHEAGLAFTPVLASTKSHKLQDGTDFYSINPLGYVPLLELDDGTLLREGPVIVQYIADQVPLKMLAPQNGSMQRYRLQEWLNFIGTEVHKGFAPLFNPATPAEYKTIARDKLMERLQWVDSQLDGKQYLMGDQSPVAAGSLFTVTNWTTPTHLDISGLTHLTAYRERVAARPAVQAAMKAEGLLK